jgi:hypothetical protein
MGLPNRESNGPITKYVQRDRHDTLRWLIFFSLD